MSKVTGAECTDLQCSVVTNTDLDWAAVLWAILFLFVLLNIPPHSRRRCTLPGPARLRTCLVRYVRRHGTASSNRPSTGCG